MKKHFSKQEWARRVLLQFKAKRSTKSPLGYVITDESGASIYSASVLAGAELPNLDVSLRGAVSIARRLQVHGF